MDPGPGAEEVEVTPVSQKAVDHLMARATDDELRLALQLAFRHRRIPAWRRVARIYCQALRQRRVSA
jgi:hypothetical protein